ncbi:hypothetical protein CYA_1070 [Synechococcus sp. JA-3-3Ab]|nr:hypothetical protein CYA_1070 [Synechococcus sp. JA-3-3Ab]
MPASLSGLQRLLAQTGSRPVFHCHSCLDTTVSLPPIALSGQLSPHWVENPC